MVKNVLFGLTHTPEGVPIIREPRLIKVSIGMPKGKAIYAYRAEGKWVVRTGYKSDSIITKGFDKREDAQKYYASQVESAPDCPYPRKNNFFLFTRKVQLKSGADHYEPAWDVMESHGERPTAIPVVFLDDDPFNGEYAMWAASEMKCHGDGIDALRVLSMASTNEEKALAEEAKKKGERFFPIVDGCWTKNCPYSKPTMKGDKELPSACKPSLDLKFQLAHSLRIGGTSYFHSSGIKSIQQTFSAIERIRSITRGRIAGIPLIMSMSSYKTNHNGQSAVQYGVSFEFRAEDAANIQQALLSQAFAAQVEPPRPRLIEAGEEGSGPSPITAAELAAEFYPVSDEDETGEPGVVTEAPQPKAATATQAKTQSVAEKLAAEKVAQQAKAQDIPQQTHTGGGKTAEPAQATVAGETATRHAGTNDEIPAASAHGSDDKPKRRVAF